MADYVLEIVEGPEAGRRIPVTGPVEIGRDPAAGAPLLQDELVSRRHARLTPVDDGVRVEDLDSRNGTFVDGDQIFGPAHLSPEHTLLVGVTELKLTTAAESDSRTSVRPIPTSLTSLRPLPTAPEQTATTAVRQVPTLAVEEKEPDYVPANALESSGASALLPLLDTHTKGKARGAPIGLFVLVAFAVILYLALR